MRFSITLLCLLLVSSGSAIYAITPQLISYQGRLSNSGGTPVPNAAYSIRFRLYGDSLTLTQSWEESQTVQTDNGLFAVKLGQIVPVPDSVLADSSLFLAMKVGADPETAQRIRLLATPYARRVNTIDGATGGTVTGPSSFYANDVPGKFYNTAPGVSHGLEGYYSGGGAYNGVGVFGSSKPQQHYGLGGQFEGGYIGVHGYVAPTASDGNAYYGIDGNALGVPGSGQVMNAVYGYAYGGSKGFGCYGYAEGAHDNYGLSGEALGDAGHNTGVMGKASGVQPVGVYGQSTGQIAFGVIGNIMGSDFDPAAAGVFGMADNGNHAGRFFGPVEVIGTLSKSAGSFTIDHPLDPAHKYLSHSFVESPDMMNIYNGNVTTDMNGDATITMPDWFESLNRDFRYQLTVIGQFAQAIVSSEMTSNKFSIKTDKSNVKVSWQITGIRHDAYANAHRILVEEEKPAREQGTYRFPELFGQPKEKSVQNSIDPGKVRQQQADREQALKGVVSH